MFTIEFEHNWLRGTASVPLLKKSKVSTYLEEYTQISNFEGQPSKEV